MEYDLGDVYESDDCSDGAYSGIGKPRVTATCLAGGHWSTDIQSCEGIMKIIITYEHYHF